MSDTTRSGQLAEHVIQEDHSLQQAAESASEALARHRWHWTLDESNSERVSLKAYARAIGKSQNVVAQYARGYALWVSDKTSLITLSEAMQRVLVSAEREAVVDAIADETGLGFRTVKDTRPSVVRRVHEMAREQAERKGTSVAEEAPQLAKLMAKQTAAQERDRDRRQERKQMHYFEMERHLVNAMHHLKFAQQTAAEFDFSPEDRELLAHSVNQIRRMLDLIDRRIVGDDNTDWDAELETILAGMEQSA